MTVTTGRELPIAPGDTVVLRTAWGARAYVEDIDRVRGSVRVRCANGPGGALVMPTRPPLFRPAWYKPAPTRKSTRSLTGVLQGWGCLKVESKSTRNVRHNGWGIGKTEKCSFPETLDAYIFPQPANSEKP
jgi:hypothetical protein